MFVLCEALHYAELPITNENLQRIAEGVRLQLMEHVLRVYEALSPDERFL